MFSQYSKIFTGFQDGFMQCSVEIRIKIRIETSFKLCSSTTLLISGATAGLVYARNGPLQQVLMVPQINYYRIQFQLWLSPAAKGYYVSGVTITYCSIFNALIVIVPRSDPVFCDDKRKCDATVVAKGYHIFYAASVS